MTPFVASLLVKATVVLALALAGAHVARRRRAAVRHLLLAAAFAVIVVLPFVSLFAPAISLVVPIPVQARVVPAPPGTAVEVSMPDPTIASEGTRATARSFPALTVPGLIAAVWIAGAMLSLLPMAAGLWQMRRVRRSASRWHSEAIAALARDSRITRPVDVMLYASAVGPMTYGVLRPAIVLPPDARDWPARELLPAAVHELEHVRRGDWLTLCAARIVCSVYWFHPLVWMARRQLALEAERACDDAVVRYLAADTGAAGDATAYADQLVGLARRLSVSSVSQLAMAGRGDLKTRVLAVLDHRQDRGRAGVRWILFASAFAALIAATLSPLRLVAQDTQAPAATAARFDAATIRPCSTDEAPPGPARGTMGGTNASFSPGRMNVPCVTLEQLIYLAYAGAGAPKDDQLVNVVPGGASDSTKVRGGPDWVHSQRSKFAVEATAAGASERYVLVGSMLRTLLEDRFKLQVHRDSEEVPMFNLVVAKSGLKITPMHVGDCVPFAPGMERGNPNGPQPCGMLTMGSNGPNVLWRFSGFTLGALANRMSSAVGRTVLDRTGVTDEFVYRLEFHPDENTPGIKWQDDADTSAPQAGSIFTAIEEQLGLKVEKTRAPRGFLVIDHVEPLGK